PPPPPGKTPPPPPGPSSFFPPPPRGGAPRRGGCHIAASFDITADWMITPRRGRLPPRIPEKSVPCRLYPAAGPIPPATGLLVYSQRA
ncbi:MAG TPA: hypothetical protein DEA44_11955, partial [Firmicutes bacterium]|nr:hypothetical protein [Bacillota bacterium]